MREGALQTAVRLAIGSRRDCLVWRNHVGTARLPDGSVQRFGLGEGSADLIGCRLVRLPKDTEVAAFFAMELKGARGRIRPAQRTWLDMVRSYGATAGVVRSVEEAIQLIEEIGQ